MAHRHFIGSSYVGPTEGAITLRGAIDSDAADQLAAHLDGFLDDMIRFICVDAAGVRSCDPRVLDLLERARRRVHVRGGSLTVVGLHPSALSAPVSPALVKIGEAIRSPEQR